MADTALVMKQGTGLRARQRRGPGEEGEKLKSV